MEYVARRSPRPAAGSLRVPGDKSVSHRAVLFAAMAEGTSRLTGVLDSADVRSTIEAVRALGACVGVERRDESGLSLRIEGWGDHGPLDPGSAIDCGNSGTTARLLMGILAGWPVNAVLTGDESLSRRPMSRVTCPLEAMGAAFQTRDGRLPVAIRGGELTGIEYDSPVASAQVKTAILLAGLRANGRTLVREPAPSRDHTERLLSAFGVEVGRDTAAHAAWVDGPADLLAADAAVPGDPSSAAFVLGAALVTQGAVTVEGVSVNPTRVGFLRVFERMGADVQVREVAGAGGEPVGDVRVAVTRPLNATRVTAEEVPSLVDEVPLLAIVATQAEGTTRFEGVGELRVKESDRLEAIRAALTALGATVRAGDDWLEVEGATLLQGDVRLNSLGDHRLAMAYAVAALAATEPIWIERYEAIDVSYPRFTEDLDRLLGR